MNSELIIYQNPDGNIKIDVRLESETVWLTQSQLCELFQKSKATISEHIKNVFEEGELDAGSTVRKFRTVQKEGSREVEREIEYYNLDVIISVGYRVKSQQGTQFRIWATQRLKEYIIKGFALNDERFKSGNSISLSSFLLNKLDILILYLSLVNDFGITHTNTNKETTRWENLWVCRFRHFQR